EKNKLEEGKFLGVDNTNKRILVEYESSSNDGGINEDNESDLLFFKETINYDLFSSKTFSTWNECDLYLHNWSRRQGFYMKKDRIMRENGIIYEDIRFLTTHCKFGATVQRKFLERKYPSYPIHSKDLYAAIQKFQSTSEMLSNNAALMSNWLDKKKKKTADGLLQEDCVLNNVIHKTNRYRMALTLFVGFSNYRHNIVLAQALLPNESLESHVWIFNEILKATNR
ncbi:25686_t:CDS:2, partial [Gigaspora rosea]